jgi:hypothetical protein
MQFPLPLSSSTIAILLLIGVIIILLLWIIHMEWRLSRLLRGNSGVDLEKMLRTLSAAHHDNALFRKSLEEYLESVEKRLRRSMQGSEVVRFNPFRGDGSGGNQSFSAAILSENGDGFIITGLHSRDRVSVYTKPLHAFASSYDLTDEEQDAVKKARASLDDMTR